MKTKWILVLLLVSGLACCKEVNAQARLNIEVNISDQPAWRLPGYDYVEYYFFPEIDCYYDVPQHQFVYFSDGHWIFSPSLPTRCRDYDLYSGYKVVINRHNAYRNYIEDRERYWKPHKVIGHDNGLHKGWYKHHERGDRD
jgi:hypothetical protein